VRAVIPLRGTGGDSPVQPCEGGDPPQWHPAMPRPCNRRRAPAQASGLGDYDKKTEEALAQAGWEVALGSWHPRGGLVVCVLLSSLRTKRDTNRGDKEGFPSREKGGSAVGKRLRWLGGCWLWLWLVKVSGGHCGGQGQLLTD
jgi:hypothetical protein